MSDNFENNNGYFDNSEDNAEKTNEAFSQPHNDEPQQTEPSKDFSSGEYHFAYPKSGASNAPSFDTGNTQPTEMNSDAANNGQSAYQEASPNNNVYSAGTNPSEAGAHIAEIIKIMLEKKASGTDLKL